nr:unnamed protein product [Spirometra erinaceieuropaei]
MTSVLRRMQFRLPDSDFLDSRPTTRSDLLAKKVAGIFPKRSIWRSLGLDYSNNPSENGGSLSCLARAARELPQLVKRACSPSSYLAASSQLPSPTTEPLKRHASCNNRIRLSAPSRLSPPPTPLPHTDVSPGLSADRSAIRHAVTRRGYDSLADITPVLERYGQLSSTASPSKITLLPQPLSGRQPSSLLVAQPASATENRSPSPLFRRSLSPNSRSHGQSTEMATIKRPRCESLSSTCQRDASTSPPPPPSEPVFSKPFLTTSSYYYQPDFDSCNSLSWSSSALQSRPCDDTQSSQSIEIPSWHVNDLLANYATELGPSKFLRPRPSFNPPTTLVKRKKSLSSCQPSTRRSTVLPSRQLRHKVANHPRHQHQDRSRTTQRHVDSGGSTTDNAENEEDTSDAAYQLRHSKLEVEEIKRERVSHQRMVEEELRSRLEKRDLESWGRRQVTRTDPLADLNPENHMPTQLDHPLSRGHIIHVVDSIPVVAFGCCVPKPTFARFSLT